MLSIKTIMRRARNAFRSEIWPQAGDPIQAVVAKMTNYQRHQWARNGYPKDRVEEFAALVAPGAERGRYVVGRTSSKLVLSDVFAAHDAIEVVNIRNGLALVVATERMIARLVRRFGWGLRIEAEILHST